MHRVKSGFTLIEIGVVLTCISILVGLMLTAINSARESARRITCQNNVRQVALAVENYTSSWRALPIQSGKRPLRSYSILVYLLPYMEQQSTAEIIGQQLVLHEYREGAFTKVRVPLISCPSSSADACNIRFNMGSDCMALHHRGFGGGGLFEFDRLVSVGDVQDGLSSTAMLSERINGTGRRSKGIFYLIDLHPPKQPANILREIFANPNNQFSNANLFAGHHWIVGDYLHTWYNHVDRPNAVRDGSLDRALHENVYQQAASVSASSYHSGGVNVSFADASVRFLSDRVDQQIWTAMGTRAGHEITSE